MTTTIKERQRAPAKGKEPLRYPDGQLVLKGDVYRRQYFSCTTMHVLSILDEGIFIMIKGEGGAHSTTNGRDLVNGDVDWMPRQTWVEYNCKSLHGPRVLIRRA